MAGNHLAGNPTWYKDAIIYEVHVRAFYDSVTDGIGDFGGLTQKLGYLEDLGVTAIWLLPFCPSPLRDDGYDISNYTDIHPAYGTMRDFQRFMREAKRRGLRVITELVLNHTSDQHVWFQRSRRAAPRSRWRNFYVWSDTPDKYQEARIIFKDFETSNWTWDPVAKAYYWHRFYSHQPDLNWDNPEVRSAMFDAMDFWFDLGVDGLRLDAVPYLIEREGTSGENLLETHAALRELRAHVDAKYKDRMLLAEANQWPEDSVAYFGCANECHMAFHFPLMPRMFMASRMEDRYPITDILRLTPAIPENCQWALFLRNHDELTLEMVTDEERDYMYRSFAHDREARINLGIRRRLAPLLENDRRKIELMNALLFSLPGTPVVYYGDEIGMGDNIYLGDRNGVRTPMQWSSDRNAGFSRANPQKLYLPVDIDPEYHYETVNVEAQQNNPHSLLWWMKRLIAQRKQFRAFGRGTMEILYPANRRVLAFIRRFEDEIVLVVANLSRFAQCAELDLSEFEGMGLVELFGQAVFPTITDQHYVLALGPHAFYWFHLEPRKVSSEATRVESGAALISIENWHTVFARETFNALTAMLPRFLQTRRWFLGRWRTVRSVDIFEDIPLDARVHVIMLRVNYTDGDPETYVAPLAVEQGDTAKDILEHQRGVVFSRLQAPDGSEGVLYSAPWDRGFNDAVLTAILRRRKFKGRMGELVASHTAALRKAWPGDHSGMEPRVLEVDQSNTSVVFGDRFLFKLFRKVEGGASPEREMQEFFTETAGFEKSPSLLGALEYRREDAEPLTIGILNGFVRSEVNGWKYTIDNLGLYYERALALHPDEPRLQEVDTWLEQRVTNEQPVLISELLGHFLENVRALGRTTADMHLALHSHPEIPEFEPEPFTDFYRLGLYHGLLGRTTRCFEHLRSRMSELSEECQEDARRLLAREEDVIERFKPLRDERVNATRIRHHGNYHLGEVLFDGKDWVIIDLEGDPSRPIGERRIKRSPLRDVAAMIRSFDYASQAVLYGNVPGIIPSTVARPQLERWAVAWYWAVGTTFMQAYLERGGVADFVPKSREQTRTLVRAFVLEKAMMEIEFEIENRTNWAHIPIRGILELLDRWLIEPNRVPAGTLNV
jgi:maltose alpha-D-glucosyltransferase / alpha-amylase